MVSRAIVSEKVEAFETLSIQMFRMMNLVTSLFLCLSSALGLKYSHLTGSFGDIKIPLDITFGDNAMVVTTHKPGNAQESFRESDNLHIFSTKIVAIRNWMDKICYIQHFDATEEQMKERVQNAIQHEKDLGHVKEERISLKGLRPLLQRSVKRILGDEIAEFCNMHQVYILGNSNYHLLRPQDVDTHTRERRFARNPPFGRRARGGIIDGRGSPRRIGFPYDLRDILVVC